MAEQQWPPGPAMTIRDLIRALLEYPADARVYVGKGMGPLGKLQQVQNTVIFSPVEVPRA